MNFEPIYLTVAINQLEKQLLTINAFFSSFSLDERPQCDMQINSEYIIPSDCVLLQIMLCLSAIETCDGLVHNIGVQL